jgi:hypothetical protein
MAVDAYVLPVPGGAVGAVFWGSVRGAAAGRAARRTSAPHEEFAVYAPYPLSPGELAELQASFVGAIGNAVGDDAAESGGAALVWWWVLGVAALVLLGFHALGAGPGYAWLAAAACATALPHASAGLKSPFRSGRAARAKRLARRVPELVAVPGANPRLLERLDGAWRVGRRTAGAPATQLHELEGFCREQLWPEAALFYASLRGGDAVRPGGRRGALLRRIRGRRATVPAYAAIPVRAP